MNKMKKFFMFSFVLVALLMAFQADAFALSCKTSQGPGSADECWTEVTVSSRETAIVSAGHLLVWDSDATTPGQGTSQVRLSRASADNSIAAGFAQGRIATGDTGRVLVYGFGKVLTVGGVTSGDYLYAAASGDVAAFSDFAGVSDTYVSFDPIGVGMEVSATNGTTRRWAKIKLI